MKIKFVVLSVFGWFLLIVVGGSTCPAAESEKSERIPVKGMVTIIDLGAGACIPCKMMAPILKKLEKTYAGRAAIVFVDVWKEKDQSKRFGIRAIPTQIFFDKEGKEVFRHIGFMSEKAIAEQLKKMGVE